ncbi:hypothetical protein GCM10020258_33780 [Sphingomonas yabuuchiae]
MKTILPLPLILSVLPVAATPAQAQTARSFALSGFDRISLEGCDNAVVTIGNAFSVRAVGQPVSLEVIRAEVRQQKLIITRPNGMCDSRAKRPGATIEITVPRLRGVESEGTGSMRLHPFEAGSSRPKCPAPVI